MQKKPYSDPRWHEAYLPHFPKCNYCINYLGFAKCNAFPEKIPKEMRKKNDAATEKFICNNGYSYEPKEDKN